MAHLLRLGTWLCAVPLPLACAQVEGGDATVEAAAPQDPGAVRVRAFTAEADGRYAEAAEAFLELVRLAPHDPDWVVRAADNLGRVGRFNDAMDLLETSRARFPDVLEIPAQLARTFHVKADAMRAEGVFDTNVAFYYQDTVRTAEQVLALDGKHLDARLLAASAHFHLGENDPALEHAERAVADHPEAYGGHAMVGRITFHRFLTAKQRFAAEQPEGAEKARQLEEIDAWRARAETAFEAAAKADPERAFPHVSLGDLAAWTGRHAVAREHYAAAMALDPRTNIDHAWLRAQAKPEEREAMYRTAIETYAQRTDATPAGRATLDWYLAQALFDRREWQAAAELWAATQTALPDYSETWYWLFQAWYWAGEPAKSAAAASELARRDPQRLADLVRGDEQALAILTGMAAEAFRSGRLPDSRDLNQVLAYALQTADAWNNYALLCRDTKRYADSLRAYEEALVIEPESPQLLNDAAVILHYHLPGAENRTRAREMYEHAIRAAEALLGSGELEGEALERTRTALRDARNNLRALGR